METKTTDQPETKVFNRSRQGILPFYHMVTDADAPHVKHLYSFRNVAAFEKDLDHFLANYRPIDLHAFRASVQDGQGIPEKSFFLSFDDGFRELFEIVRPILLRKGIPATFFLNKAFVDNKDLFYRNKVSLLIEQYLTQPASYNVREIDTFFNDHHIGGNSFKERIKSLEYRQKHLVDQVAELMHFDQDQWLTKNQPYLTSGQVQTMISDGFTFGGHSIDHAKYCTVDLEEQLRQTRESMKWVTETFDLDYKVFAFPFHDQFVSQRFFETIKEENLCELTFGTAELQDDVISTNLQRMWFENTDAEPASVITTCFDAKEKRMAEGSDRIRRPFSELRTYTIAELDSEIASGAFWRQEEKNIPITRYRARAHVENPRAQRSDLALVTMHDNDRLIGYLGVMPDILNLPGKKKKIGWLTCWWTHPEYGGKGIGQSILDRIHNWYDGAIGCSEFTELGQKAAERSGKLWKKEISGTEFELGSDEQVSEWLIQQQPSLHPEQLEYVQEIDRETEHFIRLYRHEELTKRTTAELNWLLRYPWVISAPFNDRTKERLFFSSTAGRFMYQAFKVFSDDARLIGFVILSIRDDRMTTPYVYTTEIEREKKLVVQAMALHAAALNVKKIKTYHPVFKSELAATGLPIKAEKEVIKNAFFGHRFHPEAIRGLHIQDGDGDNAFT